MCHLVFFIFRSCYNVYNKTELDPKNYLTYFKRGTVYLALGKARPALADLTLVLQLKPDFIAARYDGNTNRTTTKTYTIRK